MRFKLSPSVLFLFLSIAGLAQGANCPVRDIDLNTTITATLTSGDCHFRDLVPGVRTDTNVHVFRIQVAARGVLTVDMTSTAFDPSLYLYTTAFDSLTVNDNISRTNLNSEIVISLKSGTYILVASSKNVSQSGDYTLKTSFGPSPACTVTDLPAGSSISAELTSDDCRYLDFFAPSDDASPVKAYRIAVPQTGVLSVQMQTLAFEPYLDLYDSRKEEMTYAVPDLSPDTASLVMSLKPDTYTLYATSNDFGAGPFNLSVSVDPLRTCTPKPIVAGNSVTGNLTEETCRFLDLVVPSDDVSSVDLYALTVTDPGLVTLTMKSTDFDAYLALLDKDNQDIAEDDDSAGNTDAKIAISLNPGAYTILANTSDYGTGAYTLAAAAEALRTCPGKALTPGDSAAGSISNSSCRILDVIIPSQNQTTVDRYNVALADRSVLNLNVSSPAGPAGVGVYDGSSALVNSAVGAVAAPAASLGLLLKPDKYSVLVTLGANTGSYQLTSGAQLPKDCPVEQFAMGSLGGVLSDSACVLKDMLMGSLRTWPAKQYKVQITDPGTLKLGIASPDSIVEVIVVDANDQVVDYNYSDTSLGELDLALKPGAYTVLVALYDGVTGTYTLNADFATATSSAAQ